MIPLSCPGSLLGFTGGLSGFPMRFLRLFEGARGVIERLS